MLRKERKRPIYYGLSPDILLKMATEPHPPDEFNKVFGVGAGVYAKNFPIVSATFSLLYVTGMRIGELTQFQLTHLKVLPDRYEVRVHSEKKRDTKDREIPIPRGGYALCNEDKFMAIVLEFLKDFQPFDKPFKKWGNMSEYLKRHMRLEVEGYGRGETGLKQDLHIVKGLHPHYLRHARALHLDEYYGFSLRELCYYFGWDDPRMALVYGRKRAVWQAFTRT